MEGFCRGCLVKYEDPAELLMYTEKNRRLYVYATGVQVKRTDAIPFQLCRECFVNMKMASKFKKMCRTSDKQLKKYYALKDEGNADDFCSYLKNNDDSLMYKLMGGNSTPLQKPKEDDNESTCTSIRNFMRDILPAEEIPDTEARIIREVIEEEADILNESLDSIWLQDDMSIDTDMRLDFSFSPFSTPQTVNNDRCHTPEKLNELVQNIPKKEEHNFEPEQILKDLECNLDNAKDKEIDKQRTEEDLEAIQNLIREEARADDIIRNISEENLGSELVIDPLLPRFGAFYTEIDANKTTDISNSEQQDYTIDKNLEEALKDDCVKEFPLSDILNTPGRLDNSTPLTPSIDNILFDVKAKCESIENQHNEDILADFIKPQKANNQSEEIPEEIEEIPEIQETNYSLEDLLCLTCDKKFKNLRILKIHLARAHKIRLNSKNKAQIEDKKRRLCTLCGKYYSGYANLARHVKRCKRKGLGPREYNCDHCGDTFMSEGGFKLHVRSHQTDQQKKTTVDRKHKGRYLCTHCGASFKSSGSFSNHMRRHRQKDRYECYECGKVFYMKWHIISHMRIHQGKPFECPECDFRTGRRDGLKRHMWRHQPNPSHKCNFCKVVFVSESRLENHMKKSKKCVKIQMRFIEQQLVDAEEIENSEKVDMDDAERIDIMEDTNDGDESMDVTEAKITDLLSIPTVDEDSLDMIPEIASSNLQEEISEITSPFNIK